MSIVLREDRSDGGSRLMDSTRGDVVSPAGIKRRCHVKNIPRSTTFEDLEHFFGKEKVEGIRINLKYKFAHVQFTKSIYADEACAKSPFYVQGKRILVVPYMSREMLEATTQPSRRPREKTRKPWPVSDDDDESTRSRSASSLGLLDESANRSRSSDKTKVARQSVTPTSQVVEANSTKHILDDAVFSFNEERRRNNSEQSLNTSNNKSATKCLPTDIELLLQYIIARRSAKQLSKDQIDSLLTWLKWERESIEKAEYGRQFRAIVEANPFLEQESSASAQPDQPSTISFGSFSGLGLSVPFEKLAAQTTDKPQHNSSTTERQSRSFVTDNSSSAIRK